MKPKVKSLSIVVGSMVNLRETTVQKSIGSLSIDGLRRQLKACYHDHAKISVLDDGVLVNGQRENRDHAVMVVQINVLPRAGENPLVYFKGYFERWDPYYGHFGVYDRIGDDCHPASDEELAMKVQNRIDRYVKEASLF